MKTGVKVQSHVPTISISDVKKEPLPSFEKMHRTYTTRLLEDIGEKILRLKPMQYIKLAGTSPNTRKRIVKTFGENKRIRVEWLKEPGGNKGWSLETVYIIGEDVD